MSSPLERAEILYDKIDEMAREVDHYEFGLPMTRGRSEIIAFITESLADDLKNAFNAAREKTDGPNWEYVYQDFQEFIATPHKQDNSVEDNKMVDGDEAKELAQEAITTALYSTGGFTTDQCDQLCGCIMMVMEDYKVEFISPSHPKVSVTSYKEEKDLEDGATIEHYRSTIQRALDIQDDERNFLLAPLKMLVEVNKVLHYGLYSKKGNYNQKK